MCLTVFEKLMIKELYEYNRIPLCLLDKDLEIITYFFSSNSSELLKAFPYIMKKLFTKVTNPDFEVICFEHELYYIFSFERKKETFYFVGGPMLLSSFFHIIEMRSLSFATELNTKVLKNLVENLPIVSLASFSSCLRIMLLLLKNEAPSNEEIVNYNSSSLVNSLAHKFIYELFENKEDSKIHTPYSQELTVLNCVKDGDVPRLVSTYKALPQTKYGSMSKNPFKQLFYGCIANTTLVTRYAIEGGLEEESAFTLSDIYIKQMENCTTLYELSLLNEKMALDFTERVSKAKSKQLTYSKSISNCMNYITKNIHYKLTLAALAKEVNLTPKYLSFLFRKETGNTLMSYIEDKKVNEAKTLLSCSRYTSCQISDLLSFNSQSYFITVFKKHVGMTPKEYREQHYSSPV
ncbi:MAG: AraC-type DNA-binding protein [Herbinix sp.]|nr:AraC-type DNA-binding protein [Herbinix sp.]